MYEAAESVFSSGFHNVKLYTMVGLPTENLDDMRAFCGLIANLRDIAMKHGKRNTVHASIGIMVPKPFTPMQWVPFMDKDTAMEHIRFVREAFRGDRNVRITWADYGISHVEAFYSRGDRSLATLIYKAYQRGMVFESFSEHFSYEGWQAIWEEAGYPQERIFRQRELTEVFPWDFIHAGVNKGYLKLEYGKMFKESGPVPDCKWGDCQKCGIPGIGEDTKLASEPVKYKAPSRTPEEVKELAASRRRETSPHAYHLIYSKIGLARFIAHQNTLDIFERAFRRLNFPLNYSSGFNPRAILKNTGALPLGLQSERELLVVEFAQELPGDSRSLCELLSPMLPEGMEALSLTRARTGRMPRIESVSYRLDTGDRNYAELQKTVADYEAGALDLVVEHRNKQTDIRGEVLDLRLEEEGIVMKLRTGESGSTISPYAAFAALLAVEPESLRAERISKLEFAEGSRKPEAKEV